jgi:hypothetical protein
MCRPGSQFPPTFPPLPSPSLLVFKPRPSRIRFSINQAAERQTLPTIINVIIISATKPHHDPIRGFKVRHSTTFQPALVRKSHEACEHAVNRKRRSIVISACEGQHYCD